MQRPTSRIHRTSQWLLSLLIAATAGSVTVPASAGDACSASSDIAVYCEMQRPEDLEVIAPTTLLVSEYAGLTGETRGYLGVFEADTAQYRRLDHGQRADTVDWGDTACSEAPPAQLAPHGIHHSPMAADRLLVVNHGGRESIELYELLNADDPAQLALAWRGCVEAPPGAWLNDVAGLPDGGFLATHMVSRELDEAALVKAERERRQTGFVWRWQPGSGWSRLAGSEGGLPNGIEVDAAGRVAYINEYFGDRVTALDLGSGQRLWQTTVSGPDNNSFASDGSLLVASHLQGLDSVFACNARIDRPCALPYAVVALDTATGEARTLLTGGGDDPMGAATVAVQLGQYLYIGSFVGDRMIRRRLPTSP